MFGLLASPHLTDTFPWIAAMFPNGLHMPLWAVIPIGAGLAGLFGVLLGMLLLANVNPALTHFHQPPYWEKAIQGLVILLAVLADGLRSRKNQL
jgi:predicted ABC-type sugar transport system permease subunit